MSQDTATVAASAEPTVSEAMQRALVARDKAVDWILQRISPDGEPVGGRALQAYYRVPWTLAVVGERITAARVLTWIEHNALTRDGDLRPEGDPGRHFVSRWASYPLAIMAIGAWHLERDDTALAIMKTLRAFQDEDTGGAYAERPEVRVTSRQDLFPTAQLGMAALTTGQTAMATSAFRWIASLYYAQPELPERLYTATSDGALLVSPDPSIEWEVVTDFSKPRQAFYNPGIAAAFLARYSMQTGDEDARRLARSYIALSANGTPAQFDHAESAQICKFGWGSALMLLADPGAGTLPHVLRMVDWFIDSQQRDGRWHNSLFLVPNPTDADDLAVTTEFALHLTTIVTALAGRRDAQPRQSQ